MTEQREPKPGFVWIKTTLTREPYPPMEERPIIKTERLILKPYYEGAAEDLHSMRLQPEVMMWTSQGRPDIDLEETKAWVSGRLPPHHDTNYSFVISFIETGEVVGTVGTFRRVCETGWPEVGYALRKEAWGKGVATECMRAFLKIWWELPRAEVIIEVDKLSLSSQEVASAEGGITSVPERLGAVTLGDNIGSNRVLEKVGFVKVVEWKAKTREQMLYGWILSKGSELS